MHKTATHIAISFSENKGGDCLTGKNIYINKYNFWATSICVIISVIFLTVYIVQGKLTIKTLDVLQAPVIFFMFWINAFTKYKENKEKTSPIFRELLPWPISAIVTLIIYIYTKKVTFILIAVYSLVFLVLGAGNMFREK